MLHFDALHVLADHSVFMQKKIKNDDVFLVGGCVRDLLLWTVEKPLDIDLAMSADPKILYKKIDTVWLSHFMTEKYGTITLLPKSGDFHGVKYEITPFRTEWGYADHRHPDTVQRSDSILDDAARRDFSINCIYYTSHQLSQIANKSFADKSTVPYTDDDLLAALEKDGFAYFADLQLLVVQKHDLISQLFPHGKLDDIALVAMSDFVKKAFQYNAKSKNTSKKNFQIVVDPFGGISALLERKLRAVGDADIRFYEDALRIIRAVRFVNVINQKLTAKKSDQKIATFDFDSKTRGSLKKNFYQLQFVAKERIKEELCKIFKEGNPFWAIAILDELNLLKFLFPALHANKYVDQPIRYHPFDVFAHTLLTLKSLQELNDDYLVRFGMLYHDVGKVDQYYTHTLPLDREEIRKTFGTWLNHVNSGVDHVAKDFGALWFSSKEIEAIQWYVAAHQKPGEILMSSPDKREKKLRIMLSEVWYEKVQNILDITIADRLGQMNPLQNSADISDVEWLRVMLDRLNTEEGQFTMKELKFNGKDLMKELKMTPGPQMGELLDKAFERVRDDIKGRNTKAKILAYVKKIK